MQYRLETAHLRLRQFEKQDAPTLFTHHQEPGVAKWIPNESYQDLAEAADAVDFFAGCAAQNQFPFVLAIELKQNGDLVGDAGMNEVEGHPNEMEIGYSICEKYAGNGYATEALSAVTDFAFAHFGVKRLYGRVMKGNLASVRVLEKCGYTYVREEWGAEDDPHGQGMLIYQKERG